MIQKIIKLRNVGLFQSALPQAVNLGKTTVIYGENGRGKSTLSAVWRSLGNFDGQYLLSRKTLDSSDDLVFEVLISGRPVRFENGAWSGIKPRVLVFDAEFIEKNVHSGFEVRAEQRRNFLDFVLGEQGVELNDSVTAAAANAEAANKHKNALEKALQAICKGQTIKAFTKLPRVDDISAALAKARSEVQNAVSTDQFEKKSLPQKLPLSTFDIPALAKLLQTTIDDIEESAEVLVTEHLKKCGVSNAVQWISAGQDVQRDNVCPYCGQSLDGLELIRAYQSYFNLSFKNLKDALSNALKDVQTTFSDSLLSRIIGTVNTNNQMIESWAEFVEIEKTNIDEDAFSKAIKKINNDVRSLILSKSGNPLESVALSENDRELTESISQLRQLQSSYNDGLDKAISAIQMFKLQLSSVDVNVLRAKVVELELVEARYSPDTEGLIEEYKVADEEARISKKLKEDARTNLDSYMDKVLSDLHKEINTLLLKFNASFKITLTKNYATGVPHSEYQLELRNRKIELGSRNDHGVKPCFSSVLSDGDKRTLALAFFLARASHDPHLADTIVVIDDPVSSFDKPRKRKTIESLVTLRSAVAQLIVLTHDEFFANDLRESLDQDYNKEVPAVSLVAKHAHSGYSILETCCFAELCESSYIRDYKLVTDFVSDPSNHSPVAVKSVLRTLCEGALQRRFVGHWKGETMLGGMIRVVRESLISDPISSLKIHLSDLTSLNEYSRDSHHGQIDGTPGSVEVSELHGYAIIALKVIQS